MELEKVKLTTTWNDAAERINRNNTKIATELTKLQGSAYKNKGYFSTLSDLIKTHPTSSLGSKAYVGNTYPYSIYLWTDNGWINSGEIGGDESVELGNYYTKEETDNQIEGKYEILSQEEYDMLSVKEEKLYFCYDE